MANLLSQSLKILKDAGVQYGKEYMDNPISLVNDANEVRAEVMKSAKTSFETLKEMRRNINFRGIREWFYQKDQEYDEYNNNDDDFNPGFDADEEEDSHSNVLDRDEMDRISGRQTGAMIQIGYRQSETMMASTAEIVTTFNQRSSEIIASINNMNTTLTGISKQLENFTKAYAAKTESDSKSDDSLYDSSGRLSLRSIYKNIQNQGGGVAGFAPDAVGFVGGMLQDLTPSALVKMIFENTIGNKKLDKLGGQSINDFVTDINDKIGEGVQRGLEAAISSGPFKMLFGDIRRGSMNRDWGTEVVNTYNSEQAMFDGFVRTSIIKTIPEYLRIIARGVTGVNYNIGKDGSLTQGTSTLNSLKLSEWEADQKANKEQHKQETWGRISEDSFKSDAVGWGLRDLMANKPDELSNFDVRMVTRALKVAYVNLLNTSGKNSITVRELEKMDSTAIGLAAEIMAGSSDKLDENGWRLAVSKVLSRIAVGPSAREFVGSVNSEYQEDVKRREIFTKSGSPTARYAGVVDAASVKASGITAIGNQYKGEQLQNEIDAKMDELRNLLPRNESGLRGLRDSLVNAADSETQSKVSKLRSEIEELQSRLDNIGHGPDNMYNQQFYGSQLGLGNNGCGPVALADMLHRKGLYDPKNGMRVRDFINASKMMGSNVIPGEVNSQTLRNASPNNPITVFGHGPAFGTTNNNHFMNVLGPDGYGSAYVMNPIDGKVKRRSLNDIGAEAIVGLYGNGPVDGLVDNSIGGILGAAKNKASTILGGVGNAVDKAVDKSLAKSLERAQEYGKSKHISDEDRATMETVLSLMQTSAMDGDSGNDRQAIMQEISRIKDPKLKARLKASVGGMIDRNEKKKEGGGLLGKLLSGGKGILKNLTAPLIAGIGVLLTKILSKAKKFITPIIAFIKKRLTKRLTGIGEGIKSYFAGKLQIGGALFDAGKWLVKEVGKPLVEGLKAIPKLIIEVGKTAIPKMFKKVTTFFKDAAYKGLQGLVKFSQTKVGGIIVGLGSLAVTAVKGLFSRVGKIFKGMGETLLTGLGHVLTFFDKFKKDASDTAGSLAEKFRNTQFGKGFMSSFDAAKEKLQKREEAKNPGLAESRAMVSMMKGDQNSVLTDIRDILKQQLDHEINPEGTKPTTEQPTPETQPDGHPASTVMNMGVAGDPTGDWGTSTIAQHSAASLGVAGEGPTGSWGEPASSEEKPSEIVEAQRESDDKAEDNTTRIVEAIDALREETSEGNQQEASRDRTQQTQEVRQQNELRSTVAQNGPVRSSEVMMMNATMAENQNQTVTLTNAAADAPVGTGREKKPGIADRIMNGMGKMFGGALNAIMNIAGLITEIVMGMSGMKAIMKLVKDTLTAILKPLNGVFKEVVKTIKPVLKILTGTMKEIVASIAGPMMEILKSIAPLLEIIATVVNGILKFVSPVISGIAKAISGIVTFISKPLMKVLKFIRGFIKIIGGALGYLIHPISHKKRQKYYKRIGIIDNDQEEESTVDHSGEDEATANSERARQAESLASRAYPDNEKKRQKMYNKIMDGDMSLEEAEEKAAKKEKKRNKTKVEDVDTEVNESTVKTDTSTPYANMSNAEVEREARIHAQRLQLNAQLKDQEARRIAKQMYPNDTTKCDYIYEQIMSGKMTIDEANAMYRRKAASTVVNSSTSTGKLGTTNNLDILNQQKDGTDRLIEYLGKRYETVDKREKDAQEKADKERKEDIDREKAMYKHGTLELLSKTRQTADSLETANGLNTTSAGLAQQNIAATTGGFGKLIKALGEAFSLLPWVDENNNIGDLGESMLEKSDTIISDGEAMVTKGTNMVKNSKTNIDTRSVANSLKDALKDTGSATTSSKKATYSIDSSGNVVRNGVTSYTSGDIPYSNTNRDVMAEVIGSGDTQASFGNYLNMARRGCGPIALADAYARRTGNNINAQSLAGAMTSNGTYTPSRGTSIAGFVNASNALGMGTRVGGVTMSSLHRATPNNPITLIGSGSDFGTRTGNTHYVNAVGTDRYGGVYISNPMTGKVTRRSINNVAGSSLMGIYGSGDATDSIFSDTVKEAISNLTQYTSMFTDLFKTDSGVNDIETMSAEKEAEDNEAKIAKTAREEYSDEDYQTKVLTAMDLYRTENPIKDDETVEEYEKRISDAWSSNKNIRNKYIAMVVSDTISDDVQKQYDTMIMNSKGYYEPYVVYQKDAAGNIVHDENGKPIVTGGFKYMLESDDSDYVKAKKASIAIKKLGEAIQSASATSGVGSVAISAGGGTSNRSGTTSDLYEAASLVWEGMAKKAGGALYSYGNYGPITLRNGQSLPEIHPDCSGMISGAMNYMGYTFKGTVNGSNRRWTTHDISGKTSNQLIYNADGSLSSDWEFIPYSADRVREGDILTTPEHVGLYVYGDSANAYGFDAGNGVRLPQLGNGAAKAYLDGDSNWKSQLQWTMGPGYGGLTTILRYVGGKSSGADTGSGLAGAALAGVSAAATSGSTAIGGAQQGKIALSQAMKNAPVFWSPYPSKLTAGGYWDAAKKAGLTAAQTAMVAAIGIHEDAAQKLTGQKSLTAVTFDKNGQAAFGLMNWIPDAKNAHRGGNETKYGTTLADQLPYIKKTYFDSNSDFSRAKNVNFNQYKSGLTSALGHAPKLGQNDRWGPYAETDVAESMGHYVANALVPEGWNTSAGLAKHMRTAADAYNWMLDNGQGSGYVAGGGSSYGGGSSVAVSGFDLSSVLGEYADYLPDYYKNMYTTVQTSIDNSAAAMSAAYSSSSDYGDYGDYGDYSDEELEQGEGEADDTDTRVYATTSEVKTLYHTIQKNHNGGTLWSNSQLLSKGYGDVLLYLDHSDGSKISCKLQNNKTYAKVTTWGSWVFVYAGARASDGRPYCGWGHSSDFTNAADAINKKNDHNYKTTTVNQINSAADAQYAKWKGSSDSMMFYNPGNLQADADKKFFKAELRNHWYNSRTGVQSDINKYWKYETKNSRRTKVADPYVMLNTSYDKSHTGIYRPFLVSKLQSKTLGQLKSTPGACGDVDFNTTDSGFFVPDGLYGSGDVSTVFNDIPPVNTSLFDTMANYDTGSYTVNNYVLPGGVNNDTSDLSRTDLLNYLLKSEFTTRSPRTEKLLQTIINKLDSINTPGTATTSTASNMYDDEIPEVISNLIRG